jgi:hypothetical protein
LLLSLAIGIFLLENAFLLLMPNEAFERAASRLEAYPLIYVGNSSRPGTHFSLDTRSWVAERREVLNQQPWRQRHTLELVQSMIALGEEQYTKPVGRSILHDRYLHGLPVQGELIIREGSVIPTRRIAGVLRREQDNFTEVRPVYASLRPFIEESLPGFQRNGRICINHAEIEAINYELDSPAASPSLIITPARFQELESIVSSQFHQEMADISFFRSHSNTTYHLRLKNGWQGILKEFSNVQQDKIAIEREFAGILAHAGLAPLTVSVGYRLFSSYIGDVTLADLKKTDHRLAAWYDLAIDLLLTLELQAHRHQGILKRLPISALDEGYFIKECGSAFDPRQSSSLTYIPENIYPGHLLIDGNGLKLIDLEDMSVGPIEYALVRLLCNTYHDLPQEFIQARLQHYLSQKPGIDKKKFISSINQLAPLNQERLRRMIVTLHQENDSDAVHAAAASPLLSKELSLIS